MFFFFFFSSRRRHTRLQGDWSSDVCSSDLFRNELPHPVSDAAVALLLDCSGSMKAHARPLSLLVDLLGRALSMAGVPVDVLGFSTQAWNGGRARRDWQRAGDRKSVA